MIVFVALDTLLIVAALTSNTVESHAPMTTPTITPVSQSTEPSVGNERMAEPQISPRFLTAVSETTAWRATPGSCDGEPPVIERTTDGGETWQPLDVSVDGVRQVLALQASSEKYVAMVALVGSSCEVADLRSFTSGNFWETFAAGSERLPYVDPSDPGQVFVDGVALAVPCDFLQIARGTSLAGLCDRGVQSKNQAEWNFIEVPGALALAADEDGLVAATTGSEDCKGIAVVTIEHGHSEMIGCLTSESHPETVSVAKTGDTLWLWSGDRSYVSPDLGGSW